MEYLTINEISVGYSHKDMCTDVLDVCAKKLP